MKILITGASSGLGAALAQAYAEAGNTLLLLGRDELRLSEVAAACHTKGAAVETKIVDVCDRDAMRDHIISSDEKAPIDLVIANAGISAGTGGTQEDASQVERIFAVNVGGVLNTVQPIIPRMMARGRGQIVIMSSLAGIRALPSAPAYSASKAAVRYYGEALRGALKRHGVHVSVICPGYIITPMTSVNDFYMPGLMSAEVAAMRIKRAVMHRKGRVAFPKRLYFPLWLLSCLSPKLTDFVFSRLPAKPQIS